MAGATRYLNAANFAAPFTLGSINATPRIDAIRSFTVGNVTSATNIDVYIGNQKQGTPIFTVPANANVTMPVEETQWITFAFRTSLAFDGFAYLHIDDQPLAASGFQNPLLLGPSLNAPNGYSPLFGGGFMQWGSFPNVPTDGTPQIIPFNIAFPNAVYIVLYGIDDGAGPAGFQYGASENLITLTQFQTYITGAPPGSKAKVRWFAIGT